MDCKNLFMYQVLLFFAEKHQLFCLLTWTIDFVPSKVREEGSMPSNKTSMLFGKKTKELSHLSFNNGMHVGINFDPCLHLLLHSYKLVYHHILAHHIYTNVSYVSFDNRYRLPWLTIRSDLLHAKKINDVLMLNWLHIASSNFIKCDLYTTIGGHVNCNA